jgi:hypothetical protein
VFNGTIAYRDKKVVGVFVRFRAPLLTLARMDSTRSAPALQEVGGEPIHEGDKKIEVKIADVIMVATKAQLQMRAYLELILLNG